MQRHNDFAKRFIEAIPELDGIELNLPAQFVSVRLYRLARLLESLDDQAIRPFEDMGIKTSDDVRTLALLRSSGDAGMTNTQLLNELGGSKAGTSSRLNRLTKSGCIERSRPIGDRRYHSSVLTEEGKEIADQALTAMFNERSRLLAAFDQDRLTELAATLSDLIQEIAPDD